MLRIILLFCITLFLFAGIIGTANNFLQFEQPVESNPNLKGREAKTAKLTIKEIDKISSENNFSFTSRNAVR